MYLRPELDTPPARIAKLPVDRGYPVPWFVEWLEKDGVRYPEFRATSYRKWIMAVNQRLCWVCGEKLGSYLAFLIGPMCAVNRTTSEPPCHLECADWSARNCPFLSRPSAVRRDLPEELESSQPGIPIMRNPGVSMVWITRNYRLFSDGNGKHLFNISEPTAYSFWREGRPATRAEIEHSVETGLPLLMATAQDDSERVYLQKLVEQFRQMWPAA